MIAFERYLLDNGFESIDGIKEFNTYDNCMNGYKDARGNYCTVGLFAQPTRIGIIYPQIEFNEEIFTTIPTEDMFEEIMKQVIRL